MTKEQKPLGASDNSPDWFYPEWAANAPNNQPLVVRDADSALGRYNLQTKEIGLKDIARIHGHVCDGVVIAFIEIKRFTRDHGKNAAEGGKCHVTEVKPC